MLELYFFFALRMKIKKIIRIYYDICKLLIKFELKTIKTVVLAYNFAQFYCDSQFDLNSYY